MRKDFQVFTRSKATSFAEHKKKILKKFRFFEKKKTVWIGNES